MNDLAQNNLNVKTTSNTNNKIAYYVSAEI